MKKLGDRFFSGSREYILVDLTILYPDGICGENFNDKPYCLLGIGTLLNTFNGTFESIYELEESVNEAINTRRGKRFNYRWRNNI